MGRHLPLRRVPHDWDSNISEAINVVTPVESTASALYVSCTTHSDFRLSIPCQAPCNPVPGSALRGQKPCGRRIPCRSYSFYAVTPHLSFTPLGMRRCTTHCTAFITERLPLVLFGKMAVQGGRVHSESYKMRTMGQRWPAIVATSASDLTSRIIVVLVSSSTLQHSPNPLSK